MYRKCRGRFDERKRDIERTSVDGENEKNREGMPGVEKYRQDIVRL